MSKDILDIKQSWPFSPLTVADYTIALSRRRGGNRLEIQLHTSGCDGAVVRRGWTRNAGWTADDTEYFASVAGVSIRYHHCPHGNTSSDYRKTMRYIGLNARKYYRDRNW